MANEVGRTGEATLGEFTAAEQRIYSEGVEAITSESAQALATTYDFWTDPTHTQPAFAALMAGEFLVNAGEGDVYSEEEARTWFTKSGWRTLDRRPLAGPTSLLVAETAG